ncbi:MAG: DUF5522 domain-containing protein [Acidobacteriota bacterium]
MARIEAKDYYLENGRYVFTARYLLARGRCCGSGCRHCPYRDQPTSQQLTPGPLLGTCSQLPYAVNWVSRHGAK